MLFFSPTQFFPSTQIHQRCSKTNSFSSLQVVDGTTLYLDPGLPAINESPPQENITPSEIKPTMTERVTPAGNPTAVGTDGNGINPSMPEPTPEIESSVRSPGFQVNFVLRIGYFPYSLCLNVALT